MENPIDGLVPDFSIFGAEFTALWQKLFVAVWAGALIISLVFVVIGIAKSSSYQSSGHPSQVSEARSQAKQAGIAFVALAALVPIVGAVVFIVG